MHFTHVGSIFAYCKRSKTGRWELLVSAVIYKTLHSLAADQPKLYQLQKFEGQEGRIVMVIKQVAPDWEQLAIALRFNEAEFRAIKYNNHYQCEPACRDMFGRWLEGSARQPVSWETLIAALRDSGERDLKKLATVLDASLL